ncbi:MAG: hypothetical protein JWO31_554 [Phycisphaerales bacterium]|nr:hypothetical protein [Phycisphaerales bacterium]
MDTPPPCRQVTIEEMRAAAAATGRLARVRLSPVRFDGPDHYRVAATVNYRAADGVDASVTEEALSRELELATPLWRFRPEQALAECAEAAALRAAFPAELGRLYTRDEPAAGAAATA